MQTLGNLYTIRALFWQSMTFTSDTEKSERGKHETEREKEENRDAINKRIH